MKFISIFLIIVSAILLLITLPLLCFAISGAIAGSFEWFPTDVEIKRAIYIVVSVVLTGLDSLLVFGIFKIIKRIRSQHKRR